MWWMSFAPIPAPALRKRLGDIGLIDGLGRQPADMLCVGSRAFRGAAVTVPHLARPPPRGGPRANGPGPTTPGDDRRTGQLSPDTHAPCGGLVAYESHKAIPPAARLPPVVWA